MLSREIQNYKHRTYYSKRFSNTEVFSYTYFNHAFSSKAIFKKLIFRADKIDRYPDMQLQIDCMEWALEKMAVNKIPVDRVDDLIRRSSSSIGLGSPL
jgi:hypothetical protein